jgi:hypothetical protein
MTPAREMLSSPRPTSFRLTPAALAALDRASAELGCSRKDALEWLLVGTIPRRLRRNKPPDRPQSGRLAELHAATVLMRAIGRVIADAPPDVGDVVRTLAAATLALIQGHRRKKTRLTTGCDLYKQLPEPAGLVPSPELVARLLRDHARGDS